MQSDNFPSKYLSKYSNYLLGLSDAIAFRAEFTQLFSRAPLQKFDVTNQQKPFAAPIC